MKVKIIKQPFFGTEYTFNKEDIYETVECPLENSNLSLTDDNSVWVQLKDKKFRFFNNEYMIVSFDNKEEEYNFANSLSGYNITKIVRRNFLNGNYKKSFEILNSMVKGIEEVFKTEVFYKILLGDASLITIDSKNNIQLKEEEDLVYKDFIKKQMSQYFFYKNKFYKPVSMIPDYGYLDRNSNIDFSIDENSLYGKRASFYCTKKTSIISQCNYEDANMNIIFDKVLFDKELSKFASKTAQEAIDNINVLNQHYYLENKGYSAYIYENNISYKKPDIESIFEIRAKEEEEEEKRQEKIQEVKDKLEDIKFTVNQRAENFLGFFELKVYDKVYSVPLAPFIIWFSPSYSAMHEEISNLKSMYGEAVSSSNLKIYGDNRYHNDWVIASGLDLDKYYEIFKDEESGLEKGINEQIGIILGQTDLNIEIMNLKENEKDFLFIKPMEFYKKVVNGDCIILDKGDSSDINRILTVTEKGNGVVLTSESTKVAHIVNNAIELNFSMFNVPNIEQTLYHLNEYIYEIDIKNNLIKPLISKGTPLSLLEEGNGKAQMLSKLNNNGINVLDGIYITDINDIKYDFFDDKEYIVRSSGIEEGGDIKASGIFKSIRAKGQKEITKALEEVWNSFSSETALNYLKRLNKEIKPGILIQNFVKADMSYVIKHNEEETYISYFKGDCENIVNGNSGVEKIIIKNNETNEEYSELIKLVKNISVIVDCKNIECEIIEKDKKLYTLQVLKF